ncbi:MAG TPA: NAD-dependent epimerase/dehydratase family protein [Candidatus Omnitrophota bacterium]|nr:NAD-dependent epimerase/dehydratase family protein [Candidatus Omnitrophota bacterium]HPD84599.1 NAD-dependent epimerase/dehydratase family protein [Candidatus Omnitrophota bacterium]HRZ03457.1 NAD-dependent epimerase/dehydratase family protein [Candidatus Omnitrophota bacterium]
MAKKKMLICGATGFIGRNMAEYFAKQNDFEVYGTFHGSKPYDYPGIKLIKTDLRDAANVDKVVAGMDAIIQAAATTSGAKDTVYKPYYHVTDNAVMNSLIYRSAFEHKVSHVIFFSCTTMYPASDKPLKENDFDANKGVPPSYFGVGWTKVYLEKMCEFYARLGQTKFTAIRHSNIYGPYDKYDLERSHVFGATVAKVMTAAEGGAITVWGTGDEARDLLYVSDLVDFVDRVLKKQKNPFELVNLGCGCAVSINEIVKKIIRHAGKNIVIKHDTDKPTIKTSLCVDATKAEELFGWHSTISLDEGIAKTLDWYQKNIR